MRQGTRRFVVIVVLGFVCATLAAARARAEVVVTLAPVVEVDGQTVTVGDVASLSGDCADEVARITGVGLGPAPPPGLNRTLTREYVALRLRQAGITIAASAFMGASATQVSRCAVRVEVQAIAEATRTFVTQAMAGTDVEVEVYSPSRALVAPGKTASVAVQAGEVSPLKPGYNLLQARVLVDGEVWRTVPVHLRVRAFAPGLVAVRDLFAGSAVSAGDFALERVEITHAKEQAVADTAFLEGKRLRRFVRKGEPLWTPDLEPVPPVAKGQPLVVRAVAGSVVVSCTGVATCDGAMGEMVWIVSSYDGRRLMARVVGPGAVEVGAPVGVEGGEKNGQ